MKNHSKSWVFPLFFLLFTFESASGSNNSLLLDQVIQGKYLGEYLSVWIDSQGDTHYQDLHNSAEWVQVKDEIPNYGFSESTYWFRLKIHAGNLSDEWIAIIENPMMGKIDVYVEVEKSLIDQFYLGLDRANNNQEIVHRYHIIPLNLSNYQNATLYFRLETERALQFPLTIWPVKSFLARDEFTNLYLGMFFGSIAIMLIYNFVLFASVKDRIFLAYVGTVASTLLIQILLKGVGSRFFWGGWHQWSQELLVLGGYSIVYFSIWLAELFFNLRERKSIIYRYTSGFRYLVLLLMLLSVWMEDKSNIVVATFCGLTGTVMALVAMMVLYKKNYRPLKIYIMGWLVLLIGAAVYILSKFGFLPVTVYTENILLIGVMIEMILFSIALGDRINNEKNQTFIAQKYMLNSLNEERKFKEQSLEHEKSVNYAKELLLIERKEKNKRLEKEIENQTKEMEEVKKQLEWISKIDPLTKLYNRRSFNEDFNREYSKAIKNEIIITVMMLDVDFFKKINDQYGHLTGDDCLCFVSDLIKESVREFGGSAYRFGGEEFSVLFSGINFEGVMKKAEHIRKLVEESVIKSSDQEFGVTVSIGVYAGIPEKGSVFEDAIKLADDALYRAKTQGRNRVVSADCRSYVNNASQ